MNVPAPIFDAEGGSARLPSTVAHGSRSIADASYGEPLNLNDQNESTSDFRRLFFTYIGLALKYRWLILTFCAVALAIGLIRTFITTPIYQATVTIQIERQAAKVVKTGAQEPIVDGEESRFYQTQFDLLRSRMMAEKVAADLDLAAASDFLNPPSVSAWGKLRSLIFRSSKTTAEDKANKGNLEQRKAMAAGMVQYGLTITPIRFSSVVAISY